MNTETITTAKEDTAFIAMPDLRMVIAIAVIAYSLVPVLHEGIGHGGACVALGGQPLSLSSCSFGYDDQTSTVNITKAEVVAKPSLTVKEGQRASIQQGEDEFQAAACPRNKLVARPGVKPDVLKILHKVLAVDPQRC
jgi:hypothetical protein